MPIAALSATGHGKPAMPDEMPRLSALIAPLLPALSGPDIGAMLADLARPAPDAPAATRRVRLALRIALLAQAEAEARSAPHPEARPADVVPLRLPDIALHLAAMGGPEVESPPAADAAMPPEPAAKPARRPRKGAPAAGLDQAAALLAALGADEPTGPEPALPQPKAVPPLPPTAETDPAGEVSPTETPDADTAKT
jgi:hypothetical protein